MLATVAKGARRVEDRAGGLLRVYKWGLFKCKYLFGILGVLHPLKFEVYTSCFESATAPVYAESPHRPLPHMRMVPDHELCGIIS